MNNVVKNRLRSSLCGIAVCSVFAVSAFAVPLATVKGVAAEQEAYWCEESRDANDYTCASSSANTEYVGGDEDYGVDEEQPYQAEVKHSTVATNFDLTEFVTSYNSVAEDDNRLNASGIEYSADVNVIGYSGAGLDSEDYATYFDFDGDNGYIVINGDKEILDFKTTGDCDYLRDEDELYFSMSDGFVYIDDNGMYCAFATEQSLDEINATADSAVSSSPQIKYPGQELAGDDGIDNDLFKRYVSERYPGYVLTNNCIAYNYRELTTQMQTSYYLRDMRGVSVNFTGTASEGNCALNAIYNLLLNWKYRGLVDLNTDYIDLTNSITSDPLYITHILTPQILNKQQSRTPFYVRELMREITVDNTWRVNTKRINQMSILYTQIRDYAIDHEYDPIKGYDTKYYIDTIQYVANTLNGNTINVVKTDLSAVVPPQMLLDRGVLLSIQGSYTYQNHAVVVCGYYEYTKTTELSPGYTEISRKYFYRIADGWHNLVRIFDPNTESNPIMTFYIFANRLARC